METAPLLLPDAIFEASWEVCNKIGGIYTVLSTRAHTLQQTMPNKVIFIGPDIWQGKNNPLFEESDTLYRDWRMHACQTQGLHIRAGYWITPGRPIALLVDFTPFFHNKNQIYGWMWEHFQVDSLHAYGDYDESSMFAIAVGHTVESFYNYYLKPEYRVIFQAHEWMTGMALLYIKYHLPQVATIFTTHATTIGRSIAGNNKPLYHYLFAYNGDQMARELNVESKHSIEKQAAWNADCFTTVSEITDHECKELLDKQADIVLPNGFEQGFVPAEPEFGTKRTRARQRILSVANALLGSQLTGDTLIVGIGGRYEFKNKGIDVFIEAMSRLANNTQLDRNVLALVNVPGWVTGPRQDLACRLASGNCPDWPLDNPCITHWLHNMDTDQVLGHMRQVGLWNSKQSKVKVIFVPCYLDGNDGIMNMPYYDLLIGHDLDIYPSYYEPWGYTPLESVAFHIPAITTDLAGFGRWANATLGHYGQLDDGVKVISRTDYNYHEVANEIAGCVCTFAKLNDKEVMSSRQAAAQLAEKALWKHFIDYYLQAYHFALDKKRGQNTLY